VTSGPAPRLEKPPIPFYWWPAWMLLLAVSLVVFYGILTPVWMGIRLVAWASERARRPAGNA